MFCVKLNQSHRSSSRTINSTPELPEFEIPNDISILMNIFDPNELDVCSGNECISLNSPNVQVQQNEKTCRVTYEEWETCAEVTKTHNTDQLKQGKTKQWYFFFISSFILNQFSLKNYLKGWFTQ